MFYSMRILLPQLNKSVDVEKGTSLFTALKTARVPLASSCNGEGICNKCIVRLVAGSLAEPNALEQKLIEKFELEADQRISCQCTVTTDLTLTTTYW